VNEKTPVVSIIMGSQSDYEVMQHASKTLDQLNIEHEDVGSPHPGFRA
jgi:phosphoribosylcarboxyaminoimidazole (NCAIR) mutase